MIYPPPSRLYKYRTLNENSRKILSSSELWFSQCSKMNDPFEGRPYIPRESDLSVLTERLKHLVLKRSAHLSDAEAYQFAFDEIREKFSDAMADTTWQNIQSGIISAIDRVGVFCFSAVNNNVLMWAHYAVEHTGFCIEFDAETPGSFFNDARKVIYQNNYPVIQAYEDMGNIHLASTQSAILTKSSDWEYEQEYRVLMGAGPGNRSYSEELMTGIYFGRSMSDKDKEIVKDLVSKRKKPVNLFQGKIHPSRYLVEFDQVA
jgi:hypothetical protein